MAKVERHFLNGYSGNRIRVATEAAMMMARALRAKGVDIVVDTPERAREVYDETVRSGVSGDVRFSVADLMRVNYRWDGDDVSLRSFASAFSDFIKQKDRTLEDAERIAAAYIKAVKDDPASFVPQLKAENMSHARYFILNDGTVFGPSHPMYNSPEYETQRGLYLIYENVLGKDGVSEYLSLLDPSRVRTEEADVRFLDMERRVSGSDLMQRTLEVNAEAVNRSRVDGILNLIQYFEGNPDYTLTEKALIVKGAMTWGVVEKKSGEANEVKLVRMTDSNDISVPVIGGEAAAVVEGLRRGMNFKDALKEGRGKLAENPRRSVPGTYIGWKVYRKSSREEDAAVLQQDAAGTGWCTGGALGTARSHLSGGDFHIYFEGGEPLIAIRTQDGRMAEPPRGAHDGQFCTSREEQLAFDYIKAGNGITAGDDYVSDIEDMRRVMSPDATWRDVWMMPERRRYENGEFGGDTRSWGVAVESRMKELLDGIGKEERWEEGYFLASEVTESKASKIRFVRGDLGVGIGATLKTPALQKVVGILDVGKGATLDAPALQKVERVLFVRKGATFIAPALQNVVGRLIVDKDATLDVSALQKLGGILDVEDGATLNAPALQKVGEALNIGEGATLNAPALQEVDDDLFVRNDATFIAPALQNVVGRLDIGEHATLNAPALQKVGWRLDISVGTTLNVPALQEVDDDLFVRIGATFIAPALQNVIGRLIVGSYATLDVPALQKVGCDLSVHKGTAVNVPALQEVDGDLGVGEGATLIAPALQEVGGRLDVDDGATLNAPFLCRNFSVSDGTVYGYVLNGVIHLTPEGINPETPIHEYSHLWLTAYRKEHPDRWARLCNELERNGFTKLVSGDPSYSFLASDREAVCEETVCRIVGEKGAETLMSLSLGADSAKALVKFFRDLVNGYAVKEVFQAGGLGEELSAVTIAVLRDFAGKNPDKAKQKIDVIPPQKPDSKKTRFIRQKYR